MGELRLAWDVPAWAWRFYLGHFPLIAGLSLIASTQRLVVVNWGLPRGWSLASEVLVMAARAVLVVAVWRLATRDERLSWAAAGAFASQHWRSLVAQALLLCAAFLVFDLGAERGVGALLPEAARQPYLAVLLFVKNPTVIAFTLVWWIGLIRQVSRVPGHAGAVG
ncbi:hypothetical protein [Saccharothrix coeruleofusca]|uniref:Uncharacterized protein n=1 Tax=Saccharothrix coeruleofusca TaxID=33919 RepID=A0A918EG04_9PSEU|nr:hypothetical protein [Saccharothrix coeruleofusca]GGP69716.1 hypothetical protein GCM10010185_48240 [Saccharothrix coeruleofusca]